MKVYFNLNLNVVQAKEAKGRVQAKRAKGKVQAKRAKSKVPPEHCSGDPDGSISKVEARTLVELEQGS